MIDPRRYIDEAAADAKKRAFFSLVSPSWMNDADWEKANSLIRTKGPLTEIEKIFFMQDHDRFTSQHFMDLFFECERLYAIINWLTRPEEGAEWQKRGDAGIKEMKLTGSRLGVKK